LPVSAEVCAFTGVYSDIDFNQLFRVAVSFGILTGANANFFPDIKHRGIIPLPFPNHNPAPHMNLVHAIPHGFYGHSVGFILIALPHQTSRRDRCLFHNLNNF
jgi:hypothetical protein